jgi:hypothetical protein
MDLERLKEDGHQPMGWLVSTVDTAPGYRIVLALLTVILLSSGGISLHRRIGHLSPWKSL